MPDHDTCQKQVLKSPTVPQRIEGVGDPSDNSSRGWDGTTHGQGGRGVTCQTTTPGGGGSTAFQWVGRGQKEATVTEWLACSPPTKANRYQSPAGSLADFYQVGIVLDDAAGRRIFSGISRFPRPFIPVPGLLHTHFTLIGSQYPDKTPMLGAAQISALTRGQGTPSPLDREGLECKDSSPVRIWKNTCHPITFEL
ncbi:hypothetical protein PR048_003366 [Dryococelus australis]|uniref:Uncharacterized protein n=1 Tax=Dryococelus australis TaxID=614101 RepID=A0ABQ9IMU4_9NEOP|nr:hypothetical protein PR048_003366 [Dryococelus australis]